VGTLEGDIFISRRQAEEQEVLLDIAYFDLPRCVSGIELHVKEDVTLADPLPVFAHTVPLLAAQVFGIARDNCAGVELVVSIVLRLVRVTACAVQFDAYTEMGG
jgi:hypothetical protein